MGFEPPPNIMKAGERPARVRTGAKTATKNQERDSLEKFQFLAEHPEVLVPEWLGEGGSPFAKLDRKLRRAQSLRGKDRRLRWAARGRHLWNGYAATLVALAGGKIPSFASFKLAKRDVKFVYRTGTHRNALVGVQHYDDPEVRLVGYGSLVKRHKVLLLSGDERFAAVRRGGPAPTDLLVEFLALRNVRTEVRDGVVACPHAQDPTWRFRYTIPDLGWSAELCLDCVKALGGSLHMLLETRILGPSQKLSVQPSVRGQAFTLRPDASAAIYEGLADPAFAAARHHAEETYISYSDLELSQWVRDELLKRLAERPEGFLLVGDELWLTAYSQAAETYAESELEKRAIAAAFRLEAPRLRVSDKSLHKILEPYWKKHARALLAELSGGLLREQELFQLERLNPSEAITSLARMLGARERFREYLQFEGLHPSLEFLVTCLQIQRSGEQRVLAEKLHGGAADAATRVLTLSIARNLGEAANFEWQFAPHEKDAASFLDPYVRQVVNAGPPQFGEALEKLAGALGVPGPKRASAPTP